MAYQYTILPTDFEPKLHGPWDASPWCDIPPAEVNIFREESSDHRPYTQLKLTYSTDAIYGLFRVEDQYVRCVNEGFQVNVCKDSCVEFFVQPGGAKGYFNFEFNCGGSCLASYVAEETTKLTEADREKMGIYHSLPERIEPEITEPTVWVLGFSIPFNIFQRYTGVSAPKAGDVWYGNFYKCGDKTSHPHWASWAPLDKRNFHKPDCFGELHFADVST